jgi:5-methyltetrahydrofolate--homocysteine methyltransferase
MTSPLEKLLQERIVIIDGAMGTTIRTYNMTEADIRGARFADSKKDLLNNGDLFSLTQPGMICDIHRRFLEAGADIIETNTFGATSITQSEFFVDDPREHGGRKDPEFYQRIIEDSFLDALAYEINLESARQCRKMADEVANKDGKRRFVAGAIGPLTVSLSNSPDADDAGFRVCTFDQVKAAYVRQVRALVEGGVDTLLVETIAPHPDLGGRGARRRDDDLGADGRGALERGEAREAALDRPELLARARPHVPVPLGALREGPGRHLVLPERRAP